MQKISDDRLTLCPQCNTESLIKKVSAAGFRLKGGGWYETDFKSKNKKNVSGSDSGSSDSGASDSGSSSSDSSGSSDSKSSSSGDSGSSSSSSGGSDT